MLEYTKPALVSNLKVGKNTPDGAIELAKFSINKSYSDNEKTNSSSVLDVDISSIQTKEITKYKRIDNLEEANTNAFSNTMEFDDSVYRGLLNRTQVNFEKFSEEIKDSNITRDTKQLTLTDNSGVQVPESIFIQRDDGFRGYISLDKIVAISHVQNQLEEKSITTYYPIFVGIMRGNYLSSNNNVSTTIERLRQDGCHNTVTKVNTKSAWVTRPQNGVFANEVSIAGEIYIYGNETRTSTEETWVKHYGFCRYWGGGGSRSNNYYGDPDYKFNVAGWAAKAYMSDSIPRPTLDRYNHLKSIVCKHSPRKYPIDMGGFWTTASGEKSGIAWTYDIEEAAKYGSSTNPGLGGAVWASAFAGKAFPPAGYSSDYVGSSHFSLSPGNNSTINPTNKIITKNGAQKTSTAGFYNAGGRFYCKWFRDAIIFYKGKTTKTKVDGKYNAMILTHGGSKIISVERVVGLFAKKETLTIQGAIRAIECEAHYSGYLYRTKTNFSGIATYKGNVYKKYRLNKPVLSNGKDVITYVGDDGLLTLLNGKKNIERPYIEITNMSVNGIPLYYKYECANNITIISTDEKIVTDTKIAYIHKNNFIDINYIFVATKIRENTYKLTVLLDKPICYKDDVKIEFLNNEKKSVETIATSLLLTQNVDYKMISNDNSEFLYSVDSNTDISDTRRKIQAVVKIKTTLEDIESNEYSVSVVNKKYALSSELSYFKENMMQISIADIDGSTMTAKEIVSRDSFKTIDELSDSKFYVQVISSSGTVDVYTEEDGSSPIYIETLEDTGTLIGNEYTGSTSSFNCTVSLGDRIKNGYYIREIGQELKLTTTPKNMYAPIYINIHSLALSLSGTMDGKTIFADYVVKDNGSYDQELGRPYVTTREVAKFSGQREIILDKKALMDKRYIKVTSRSTSTEYEIEYTSIKSNSILLKSIPSNKDILVTYMHIKDYVEYRGHNGKILDLNTLFGHEYYNHKKGVYEQSSNLINKTLYVFIKPKKVYLSTGEILVENSIDESIYYKIDDGTPEDELDTPIGVIYLSDNVSYNSVKIQRSNIIGGGVHEKYLEKNIKNARGIFDIEDMSEKIIKNGATLITYTDNSIVKKDKIKELMEKFLPIGTLNII